MKRICLGLSLLLSSSIVSAQDIGSTLQDVLDSIYEQHPLSIGLLIHIESPDLDISWSGASGYDSKDRTAALQSDQPVLIASSIKTLVSATLLKLVEMGELNIDEPIDSLLTTRTRELLDSDGYDLSAIQIKHLLSHTSGLYNYANQAYIDHKDENRNYRWTRDEQIHLSVYSGEPVGKPGERFEYADVNYLLLTEIIEGLTDLPFYEAMRELINYDAIGMHHTWFPTLEPQPSGTTNMAHQYWDKYDWDSHELDISWDLYGGGGIACPVSDLAKFAQAYFTGLIVKQDSIRDLIFTEIRTPQTELTPYYQGLAQNSYHGMNVYGHGGFWGTVMYYVPHINSTISIAVLERGQRHLQKDIAETVLGVIKGHSDQPIENSRLTDYLNQIDDFSGTILIADGDEILEHRAYGLSNIENNVKNNLNSKFNLASISKLITSTATLQLVEKEIIHLDSTVGHYLPDYPNDTIRNHATIKHLLTHQSGIPPFYGKSYLTSDKLSYSRVDDYLDLFDSLSLNFFPGEKYEYGGGGFVVLGKIIEETSGMDYYQYIDRNIFAKANMKNSLAIPTDSVVNNTASGYTRFWGDQNYLSKNDHYTSKASPAGGHYSTALDLFHFMSSLRDNTLLQIDTYQELITPRVRGYNTHLGYGIDIDGRYDETIIGHSGGWFGVRTELMYFEASDLTVVVLSNQDDDGSTRASRVIDDLREIIAGPRK